MLEQAHDVDDQLEGGVKLLRVGQPCSQVLKCPLRLVSSRLEELVADHHLGGAVLKPAE
jgi:hypothetical protein